VWHVSRGSIEHRVRRPGKRYPSTPARGLSAVALLILLTWHVSADDDAATPPPGRGAEIYNYYCYQCHGYSGDARTLASTYLDPRPRDFTSSDSRGLRRGAMIAAVTRGRPGTAMTAFASVLADPDVAAVVDYVRQTFMGPAKPDLRYHTAENGWHDHSRYATAFPFVTGELALNVRWETLSPAQRRGKKLYLEACVSCHDHGAQSDDGPVWELRALSYPRKHYSHRVDIISGASPYAVHDSVPHQTNLSPHETLGEQLYQDNCAFCHAADGTARNWIGSFLQPRPRDLTRVDAAAAESRWLREVIRNGLPGTSMPAWRQVLGDHEIEAIIAYLRRVFGGGNASG